MIIQYELLKETIAAPLNNKIVPAGAIYTFNKDGDYVSKEYNSWFSKEIVENNLDWFRKVEPKEWEILSMIHENHSGDESLIFKLQSNGKYKASNWPNEDFDLNEDFLENKVGKKYLIQSVRRISDGEILTVDTEARFAYADLYHYALISRFEIAGNLMMVYPKTIHMAFLEIANVTSKFPARIYTEKDILEAEERAWNAAREKNVTATRKDHPTIAYACEWNFDKYQSFSDYKNKSV